MNILSKIFNTEEKFVGLCSLKRKNRKTYCERKPYYTNYFQTTNTTRNVYLAI